MRSITFVISFIWIAMTSCGSKQSAEAEKKNEALLPALNHSIVGVAEVQPQQKVISLYPQTGGIVKIIHHDINDHVVKGEVIAELINDVEQAQLAQARSKLSTQLAVIQSSYAQLASLQVKSDNAKHNYGRNQNLLKSGGVTQQAFDDSKFAYESSIKDAEASQSISKQQQEKLNELKADVNYYQQVVNQKMIKAPFDGTMLSVDSKVGNFISTSQSFGDFAPDGKLMAITEVDELYADKVHEGIPAYIRHQGSNDTLAMGKVFLTSPYLRKKSLFSSNAANMEDRRVREVRVLLDEGSKVLIGSRVECVIQLQK